MRAAVSLAIGQSFSYFAVRELCVLVIGGEFTAEMCRATPAAIERVVETSGGSYALLIDYHGPLVVPPAEVRREVVAVSVALRRHQAAARAVVIRGNGVREQALRAFVRATTLVARGSSWADCPAITVEAAIGFLGAHVQGVPSFDELEPLLRTEYRRLGLTDAPPANAKIA